MTQELNLEQILQRFGELKAEGAQLFEEREKLMQRLRELEVEMSELNAQLDRILSEEGSNRGKEA